MKSVSRIAKMCNGDIKQLREWYEIIVSVIKDIELCISQGKIDEAMELLNLINYLPQ